MENPSASAASKDDPDVAGCSGDTLLALAREMMAGSRAGRVETWLDGYLAEHSDDAHAWLALSELKEGQGHLEDALDDLELALHHAPALREARSAHVRVLLALGRRHDAETSLREALACGTIDADIHFKLGNLLSGERRFEEAVDHLLEGLRSQPGRGDMLSNLSHAYLETGRIDEAIEAARKAIGLSPHLAEAHHNLAVALLSAGEPEPALGAIGRAIEISSSPASRAVAGHALRDLGRIDEAIRMYDAALGDAPGLGDARINRCYAMLLAGMHEQGWREYRTRFDATDTATRGFPYPEWDGTPLAGRRVLIYAEQGLGDEIMFASCIPDVIRQAEGVVIECNTRLAGVFARSFPSACVHGALKSDSHGWLREAGLIDCQVAMGDLPGLLGRREGTFPAHSGYFIADPVRRGKWRARLDARGAEHKVGISWRGGTAKTRERLRSVPVDELATALSRDSVQLVSLQYGSMQSGSLGEVVVSWPNLWDDIDEVAALMAELDVVVTVDNTVAHLAGALGCPGIVLLPSSPEWRWGMRGDRMAWYPSLRLARRSDGETLESALENAGVLLDHLLETRGRSLRC